MEDAAIVRCFGNRLMRTWCTSPEENKAIIKVWKVELGTICFKLITNHCESEEGRENRSESMMLLNFDQSGRK